MCPEWEVLSRHRSAQEHGMDRECNGQVGAFPIGLEGRHFAAIVLHGTQHCRDPGIPPLDEFQLFEELSDSRVAESL